MRAAATAAVDFRESAIRRAIVVLVALKIAGIILVIDPRGLQSFDLPKSLYSRALAWLIGGCLAFAFARYGFAILPRTRLHLFVAGFALIAAVTALGAEVPYVALYGDQDSYLGLTLLFDMLVLYVAVAIAFRDRDDALALTTALCAASALAPLYGAVQRAGLDPLRWSDDPRTRPFSTFGHPDDFGFALAILFGAAAAVGAAPRVRASVRLAAAAIAAAAITMAGVVATRGTLVGVAAGVLAIAFSRVHLERRLAPRNALPLAAAAVLIVVILAATPLGARTRGIVAGAPIADRVLIWASALDAFAERPLLGFGPDGFAVAYPEHRVAESASILGPGRPQVSAHDWVLQAAVSYGAIGLAALIALVAAGTLALIAALRRNAIVASALLAGWSAYWAQGLVTVGSISVDWVPWVALGAAAALTGTHASAEPAKRTARAFALATLVACVLAALSGIPAAAANRDARSAAADDPTVAVASATRAVARDPGRAAYWNRLGLALERGGRTADAAAAYAQAALRAPYRSTYAANLAWVLLELGQTASAVEAASVASAHDPNDPFAAYALAEARRAASDCDGALAAARRAMWLYHDGPGFSRSLARAALCASDAQLARTILEQAVVWDSAELHAALSALLYAAGEVERARQHATRALQIDPRNAVATAVLGALAQR